MKHFEVYINAAGYGQTSLGVAQWPAGDGPIFYAHFLAVPSGAKREAPRFGPGPLPAFGPEQLLYVGERSMERNLRVGFKQNGYAWLTQLPNSVICAAYWRLPDLFKSDNERKTLEAMIHADIFQRYQMQPLVLRFNGGMQFTRAQTHNLQVLRKKYEILADLTRLGV